MSKNNEYIKAGKCIWCLEEKPLVTFNKRPHTISKKLGAMNVGFDICDVCNEYFGTIDRQSQYPMSVELAFKEIFNVIRFLLKPEKDKNSYRKLKSIYFDYYHTKQTLKIRNSFKLKPQFISHFTRQFKRGVYQVFLQEFHRCTEKGLNNRFDGIRDFTRHDIGELPLYFLVNNGVYFIDEKIDNPSFSFNKKVKSVIEDFGFYQMWLMGFIFFLEVTPKAKISREIYLPRESQKLIGSGFLFKELKELKKITDIDFTLRILHG